MLLTPYGLREWLTITVLCVALAGAAIWLGWWWLAAVAFILWLAGVGFFRDPIRRVPNDLPPGTMLSPADGTVRSVTRVDQHDATDGPAVVIRIFLSVLNVHINRFPESGEVVSVKHTPGKYLDARKEESAKLNESNLVVYLTEHGDTLGIRQISGAIARRIVCPITPGERFSRGQRYGMIKFGSTTELILPRPDDVMVHVREGQKVKAGIDVLATLPPRE